MVERRQYGIGRFTGHETIDRPISEVCAGNEAAAIAAKNAGFGIGVEGR